MKLFRVNLRLYILNVTVGAYLQNQTIHLNFGTFEVGLFGTLEVGSKRS